MALADSRAFLNPLVVSFDHLLEIGVGKKARRDVSSKGADLGPLKLFQACLRLWTGCREMETAVRKPRNLARHRGAHCTCTGPLPLLPSGPGGVHRITSRGTRRLTFLILSSATVPNLPVKFSSPRRNFAVTREIHLRGN